MTSQSRALTTTPTHTAAPEGAAHAQGGISNVILGMLLFITSEVMFFAGLFAAYFSTRAANKPWPPTQFAHTLNPLSLILVATIILIASSFTCQFAVWAIRRGDRRGFIRNISVTFVLGIIFLVLQAYDYTQLFDEGLKLGSGPFGTTYFTLTGFHGAHVFAGVVWLSFVLTRALRGGVTQQNHMAVELVGLYWHFVDLVWIIIFTIVYLL